MAGFPMCAGLPRRVRGPGRPALPRPADRLPGLRAARAARWRGRRRGRRRSRRRSGRGGRACAAGRRDRRGQGPRRLPPRLPRRRRGRGRAAARPQAPRGQAVRADGRRRSRRRARWSRSSAAEGSCSWRRARPIVLAPRRADARGRPVGRPGRAGARRDAAVHAAAPSPDRRRGRAARHDERQRRPTSRSPTTTTTPASGWPASPTCSSSTTGRSRPAPTTR